MRPAAPTWKTRPAACGATIEADDDANTRLYGKDVAAADILHQNAVQTTAAGKPLISLLDS